MAFAHAHKSIDSALQNMQPLISLKQKNSVADEVETLALAFLVFWHCRAEMASLFRFKKLNTQSLEGRLFLNYLPQTD